MNSINLYKVAFITFGGVIGWIVDKFEPTFPLIIITLLFILYDSLTAYQLGKRVKRKYPQKKLSKTNFSSKKFEKVVVSTIPKRLIIILLAFMVEKWVFVFIKLPLSYVVTGIICFEQAWSILENESSCREDDSGQFWKLLQKIMKDKTEKHFDINLDEITKKDDREKE